MTDQFHARLKQAVVSGNARVVRELLIAGVNSNLADENGATLLIHAAPRGHAEVCRLLIENGTDQYCLDRWGQDAIDYARRNGHGLVVETLRSFLIAGDSPTAEEPVGHADPGETVEVESARAVPLVNQPEANALGAEVIDAAPETGGEALSAPPKTITGVVDLAANSSREISSTIDAIEDHLENLLRELLSLRPQHSGVSEELSGAVDKVLSTLTPREEEALRKRFGIGGNEYSSEEIASQLDVTRERVREIEAKALRKLRHPSRVESLRDFLEGED